MAERVKFMFTRTGTFTETGGVEIEVNDPIDWEEIEGKLNRREFKSFLVSEREYTNEEWEFDDLEPGDDDDDEAA